MDSGLLLPLLGHGHSSPPIPTTAAIQIFQVRNPSSPPPFRIWFPSFSSLWCLDLLWEQNSRNPLTADGQISAPIALFNPSSFADQSHPQFNPPCNLHLQFGKLKIWFFFRFLFYFWVVVLMISWSCSSCSRSGSRSDPCAGRDKRRSAMEPLRAEEQEIERAGVFGEFSDLVRRSLADPLGLDRVRVVARRSAHGRVVGGLASFVPLWWGDRSRAAAPGCGNGSVRQSAGLEFSAVYDFVRFFFNLLLLVCDFVFWEKKKKSWIFV